jgi:hypothetical protein
LTVTDRSLRGICHEGSNHEKNQALSVPEHGRSVVVGLKAILSDTTNFDCEGLSQRVLAQTERRSQI